MSDKPASLPVLADGHLLDSECVRWKVVLSSPLVEVAWWRCLGDSQSMRSERTQKDFTIKMLQTGACRIREGGRESILDPATVAVQGAGFTYRSLHPWGFHDSGWTFAFRDKIAYELLDRARAERTLRHRPLALLPSEPVSLVFRQLILLHRRQQGLATDPLTIESLSFDVFERVFQPIEQQQRRRRRPDTRVYHRRLVERTREYLNASHQRPLDLSELATAVASSPAHLCRVFKREMGISIGEYARRLRVGAVFDRLTGNASKLAEIARIQGYCNPAHLASSFRRTIGFSPRDARRFLTAAEPPVFPGMSA